MKLRSGGTTTRNSSPRVTRSQNNLNLPNSRLRQASSHHIPHGPLTCNRRALRLAGAHNCTELIKTVENYRPPRKCTFKFMLDSFSQFISNFTYSNQSYENLWNTCDSLIDDVSEMLNQDMYGSLSLTEHCERLNSCFNVLKKIHDTATKHINLIKTKIRATDYHLEKWTKFLTFIKFTKDIDYLKAWRIYHGVASGNMQRIQKINRILYAELDIADKYSQLTSRTINIFSTAASRLQERIEQRVNRENGLLRPSEDSDEYKRRQELIKNSVIKVDNLAKKEENLQTSCCICLAEFEKSEEICKLRQCNHYFHSACLKEWLIIKLSCPFCRQSIDDQKKKEIAD